MNPAVGERIEHLIWHYGLHDDPETPVPIFRLEPLFPVVRCNLDDMGMAGMVVLPAELPVTESNFASVMLSDRLSDDDERIVYAHECAHGILGHEGELRYDRMDQWFTDRNERQAWEIAARLLVPMTEWWGRGDLQRIAGALRVPPALVRLAYG